MMWLRVITQHEVLLTSSSKEIIKETFVILEEKLSYLKYWREYYRLCISYYEKSKKESVTTNLYLIDSGHSDGQ